MGNPITKQIDKSMRKAAKALLELKANHGLEIESLSTEVVFEGITYVLTFKRKD